MPEWLQTVTVFNPLRAVVSALQRIFFKGAGTGDVLTDMWPMFCSGFIGPVIAEMLFRHRTT